MNALLPRRGRPPFVHINGNKAEVRVRGRIISVPLTRASNVAPKFEMNADEDEAYAIAIVRRRLSTAA